MPTRVEAVVGTVRNRESATPVDLPRCEASHQDPAPPTRPITDGPGQRERSIMSELVRRTDPQQPEAAGSDLKSAEPAGASASRGRP